MALRIERDSPRGLTAEASKNSAIYLQEDLCPVPEAAGLKYLNSYHAYFHHRWTIIHSPSLEIKTHVSLVLSSMKMIGAWISGAQDEKSLAIDMHERLTAHMIPHLVCR